MKKKSHFGFTLMELMIVMAIIAALFALLLPGLFNRQKKIQINQAEVKIKQIGGYLEQYSIENRGYPTTEQGLYALIYIPDNVGVVPQTQGSAGFGGTDSMMGNADPTGGMGGQSVAVGPGALNNPAANPAGNFGGTTDSMMSGGMTGTTGGWTQPVYNPAIYTQQRKRPAPYVDSDKELIDPWGTPYRYDNSLPLNGVNQTGTAQPAIWSAGPDKQDGTDDDIRNWNPVEAQQAIAQRQAQAQGMTQGGMNDPMGMGQQNLMGNQVGAQPGNMNMGNPSSMPTMPTAPTGIPTAPTGGMPTVPNTPAPIQ
ncbi:hypothetical protein FACS189443_4670 [Planctomycetales bacterium]|nr:hypothetical protein FACS189443_4670 [Planctomycetales bacterium]